MKLASLAWKQPCFKTTVQLAEVPQKEGSVRIPLSYELFCLLQEFEAALDQDYELLAEKISKISAQICSDLKLSETEDEPQVLKIDYVTDGRNFCMHSWDWRIQLQPSA
jgi:hypothetical protein